MKLVELYARVRYAVRIEGLSRREAARRFGIDPRTVAKMLSFSVPPGYRRSRPAARPKLDPFVGVIDQILQRYERGSTIVTSNLPFDEWTSVFASERLTGALLDRLTHHVHILEMNGDSYRLKQSKQRQRGTRSADTPDRSPEG